MAEQTKGCILTLPPMPALTAPGRSITTCLHPAVFGRLWLKGTCSLILSRSFCHWPVTCAHSHPSPLTVTHFLSNSGTNWAHQLIMVTSLSTPPSSTLEQRKLWVTVALGGPKPSRLEIRGFTQLGGREVQPPDGSQKVHRMKETRPHP